MESGDRKRWNRLSYNAKAIARLMAKYADVGRVTLNDFRLNVNLSELNSRDILAIWNELESRAYGQVHDEDSPNPVFVMNVSSFQTLAQSHRLTDQAPHRPQ